MFTTTSPNSIARLMAMVALAYVLVLNGLLGSISAGAHVAEARTATQLGVICTIHGIGNSGADGTEDPTPGKLACIEHCVLVIASAMPGLPETGSVIAQPDLLAEAAHSSAIDAGHRIASVATPPPLRGPPAAI